MGIIGGFFLHFMEYRSLFPSFCEDGNKFRDSIKCNKIFLLTEELTLLCKNKSNFIKIIALSVGSDGVWLDEITRFRVCSVSVRAVLACSDQVLQVFHGLPSQFSKKYTIC
jgi:hypothetical protein